ncbi:MAG: hypothetical protein Tp1100MES1331091_41 [Prokaryotic dsDNA virus sp.]|mgnify:CR=1 FL=1|nr:MAG: hypothetical protein Tp1100MES1331091_41 [Prokaryotic dsDNA virus sp.]|tara:strand:- start:288 stop:662 length:375 start_codon:yes stop_codon:yes gene_type:complete
MAYVSKQALVGKKFRVKVGCRPEFDKGEIVEVTRIDNDGDIVVQGERDFRYVRTINIFNREYEPYHDELENKWIVWNENGSLTATSEEAAKAKAEELLNDGYNGPIYIAKAMKKAEINRVVWTD